MNNQAKKVIHEVSKVMIGKDEVINKVFQAILAEGHILLEDIPGVGKTTLALAFSKAMDLDFNRIQFTPDVVASDITGFTMYDRNNEKFVYKEGATMCHLLLGDEINRTTSRTQSALLEVMEEKKVTVDGETYHLPQPFHVIATQNPLGAYGTQALPQSQLDRFTIKISVGYPDNDSLIELLKDRQTSQPLDEVKPVITREDLIHMQKAVRQIHISEEILKYITHLTEATRNHNLILQGVSPRGALALSHMAKSRAFMFGRSYVVPEDVLDSFIDTYNHRIILDHKAQMAEDGINHILYEIMEDVKTPDNEALYTF